MPPKVDRKLNIVHVTYDMRIGGTEMVIRSIIEGCDTAKFNMSIFCIESPIGPWGQELLSNGITIHSENRKPGFDISLIKALRNYIKQNDIDIVHCHQYTPWVYGTLAAFFARTTTKARVIFTEHGRFYPDSTNWKRRIVNPLLQLLTHNTTAISKATKQALIEYEFFAEKDVSVIYNGINPIQLESASAQERLKAEMGICTTTTVLGTIARFDPIKNHVMMLEAFAQVHNECANTVLIIVGDGDERPTIESSIRSLGLTDSVILTGYKTNPSAYLSMMDVFLLSSLSEGTSMTLLEAMSLGKPCVVTDAGGNAEIIMNEENGYVTTNGDASEFAGAILRLINHTDRERFEYNARLRFEQNFSSAKMVEHFAQLYEA